MSTIQPTVIPAGRGTPYMQAVARRPRRPRRPRRRPAAAHSERTDADLRRRLVIGQRIREARQRLGLSQRRLSLQIDMFNDTQMSDWETGKVGPSALTLERLAEALGEPLHYFYGGPSAHPLPLELDPDPYAQPPLDPAAALPAIGELLQVLDRVSALLGHDADRLDRAGELVDTRLDALRALGFGSPRD